MIGPTDEEVKNSVMARNPGKYFAGSRSRPMKNAKNRKVGIKRPKM
jgi:hypothetical protein